MKKRKININILALRTSLIWYPTTVYTTGRFGVYLDNSETIKKIQNNISLFLQEKEFAWIIMLSIITALLATLYSFTQQLYNKDET